MPAFVLDTNLLVSYFTDRDLHQQALARRLFHRAIDGKVNLFLPSFIVLELIYVLENLYSADTLQTRSHVGALVGMPGLTITEASWAHELLSSWPSPFSDAPDAALAAVAIGAGAGVATFDAKTRKSLAGLEVPLYPDGLRAKAPTAGKGPSGKRRS